MTRPRRSAGAGRRRLALGAVVVAAASCGGGDDDAGNSSAAAPSPARSELVSLFAGIGLDRACVEEWVVQVSDDDARLLAASFDSPDLPEGVSAAGAAALDELEACAGDLADGAKPATPSTEPADDAALGGRATVTADDICAAIDPAVVAASLAPVTEIQRVDERYCNVLLDLEGMGNSLNVSIQPPLVPGQDPNELFDATVQGRVLMAGGEVTPSPVDGIGDRAVVIPGPQGNVVVALVGATVVNFDPMLASGDVAVDQWQAILGPALATM